MQRERERDVSALTPSSVCVSRTCRLCREPELTPSWLQVRASSARHGHFDLCTIVRCCVPDCEKSPRTNRVTHDQVREGMEFLSLSFEQRGTLEDMSKLDFVPRPESRHSHFDAKCHGHAHSRKDIAEACAALDGRSTRRVRRRT